MSYKVRNNGKVIGVVEEVAYNVKRINRMLGKYKHRGKLGIISGALAATMIIAPIASSRTNEAVSSALTSQEIAYESALDIDASDLYYNQVEEKVEVEYTVRYNDTLSGIIYSKITEDADLEKQYESEIVRDNNLRSASNIVAGTVLKIKVPISKMGNFGYTEQYDSDLDKIDSLLHYIDQNEDLVYAVNDDSSFERQKLKDDYKDLKEEYQMLDRIEKATDDEDAKEATTSEKIAVLEEMKEIVQGISGISYKTPIERVSETSNSKTR